MDNSKIEKDYPELAGLSRDVQIRIIERAEEAVFSYLKWRRFVAVIPLTVIAEGVKAAVGQIFLTHDHIARFLFSWSCSDVLP